MELFDVCNNYMLPHVAKPLSETHSRYFLELLNEYDAELQNYLYYGAISYNGSVLMAGTEYDFATIVDVEGDLFDKLINPQRNRYRELRDIYMLANKKNQSVVFIPVLVKENMLMFVCTKEKSKFLGYLQLHSLDEIYDTYPVLCAILNWGITYMLSDNCVDRLNDLMYTDVRQSENYIKDYNYIVENVMRTKWLPYASTLHTIL